MIPDQVELQVHKESRVMQEQLAYKELKVMQEQPVHKEFKVKLEQPVHQVRLVFLFLTMSI